MADNVGYTPGVGAIVAADDIAGVLHQRVKLGIGGDGVAVDVSAANPMPITAPTPLAVTGGLTDAELRATPVPVDGPLTDAELRASAVNITSTGGLSVAVSDPSATTSFGPITTANTVLFAAVDTANKQSIQLQASGLWIGGIAFQGSDDGTTYFPVQYVNFSDQQAVDTLYAPNTVVVPVTTRFFRAITTRDFVGSVSGVYALRFAVAPTPFVQSTMVGIDPQVTMPVGGITPTGMLQRISVADNGGVRLADGMVITGTRSGIQPGTVLQLETTGYGSTVVQLVGTWTGTVTFQVSNDTTTWAAVNAWTVAGGATPVTTATAVGQWVIPASGRYFRVQITTAGTGVVAAVAVQKNFSAWMPLSTASFNIASVGAVAVTGGVALGTNGATNGASVTTLISAASNNLTQLKATLGRIHIIDIQNTVASIRYLKLFSLPSASVTMGTTSATQNYSIPASGKLSIVTDLGINLGGTGVSYALTGGSSLTDNTAIGAGDLIANFQFV
jgi:hypothetical protein